MPGFATDANLAHLIELGYTVVTKVHSGHTTSRLQRGLGSATVWERVGANAEAVALGAQRIGDGRYALQALQVRYQVPEGLRHTTLLYYDDAPPPPPAAWFAHYNGRQVIEAGIKENKGVFAMRRPLVRSAYGMQIQEQFALFAANFVRWAAAWARDQIARRAAGPGTGVDRRQNAGTGRRAQPGVAGRDGDGVWIGVRYA